MAVARREQYIPVEVVGGNTFGIYPKISLAATYNMYISDGWLINYPGYKKWLEVAPAGSGRGFFHSTRNNLLFIVANDSLYKINTIGEQTFIANLETSNGPVVMDENLNGQVCIVDGQNIYIYNIDSSSLTKQNITFAGNTIVPNYVVYHDTFFLIASRPGSANDQNWYVMEFDTPTTIVLNTQKALQNSADATVAVVKLPGHGNNVLVLGQQSGELWTNVGGEENYKKVQSFSLEVGCVSASSIAYNEDFVAWLSTNKNNSPVIKIAKGASTSTISTDGINEFLPTIKRPDKSYGMMYALGTHLIYQLTFYDSQDNVTLIYDFSQDKFFYLTDKNYNYHPARAIVYFDQRLLFLTIDNPSIYELSRNYVSYIDTTDPKDIGHEIPRIRICPTVRRKNAERFITDKVILLTEQGVNNFPLVLDGSYDCLNYIVTEGVGDFILSEDGEFIIANSDACGSELLRPSIDLAISKNGNQSFGNYVRRELNHQGIYRNQCEWRALGQANEITLQFRFWGHQPFVVGASNLEVSE